jgi:hypothetical protein
MSKKLAMFLSLIIAIMFFLSACSIPSGKQVGAHGKNENDYIYSSGKDEYFKIS